MVKYVFKEDFLAIKNAAGADPQKVGEALAAVAKKNGGELRPDAVVEAAQSRRSPLHRHFEWDDAVCGILHRREQARELIRVIRVVEGRQAPRRAFLSVSTSAGTAYHPLAAVLSSVDLQMRVLDQAMRDVEALEKRYKDIEEICAGVRDIREQLRDRRARLEAGAAARQ